MWAAARHASIGQACDAGHMSTSTVFAPVEYLAAVQYQASFLSSLGHAIVATIVVLLAIGLIIGLLIGWFSGREMGRRQGFRRAEEEGEAERAERHY